MKKTILFIFAVLIMPFAAACEKEEGLIPYVSEIRSDVLTGQSENYSVKAYVLKSETPLSDDGTAGSLAPYIRFFLKVKDLNAVYRIDFSIGEKNYSCTPAIDPATGEFIATAETESLPAATLTVNVCCGGLTETAELNSIVPETALTPQAVLDAVYLKNPDLFNSYNNEEGKFCAEIRIKITVKDGKPYYFFGILDGKSRKAFLADGYTGEVLAVRNVF